MDNFNSLVVLANRYQEFGRFIYRANEEANGPKEEHLRINVKLGSSAARVKKRTSAPRV